MTDAPARHARQPIHHSLPGPDESDAAGCVVNPVDLSRVLRPFPIVQHEFKQQADLSCELVIRPLSHDHRPDAIASALRTLLGDFSLAIRFDPVLGANLPGGKVIPYQSESMAED